MSDVTAWSTTAASNNSSPPDGWPENMTFASVNNAARENMRAVACLYRDMAGFITSTGSSNAYVVAPDITYASYVQGVAFVFLANHANTGACTLQVDALAAKALKNVYGEALVSGDITASMPVIALYDATNGYFRAVNIGAESAGAGLMTSLSEYNVIGDGSTTDQDAVVSAVAACYASGESLYWPEGTYLTTATIPYLHSVRHFGPGVLKRGSDLFYPGCGEGTTNTIYVSATGDANNDGITSSQPMLTPQAAFDAIYGYNYGDVTWVVQCNAATFSGVDVELFRPFSTPNPVQLLGAGADGSNVPTTIFASSAAAGQVGVYAQHGVQLYVKNIKFTGYRDGGSPATSGTSAGLIAFDRCWLDTYNVHAYDCDQGIECSANSRGRIQRGVISTCAYGIVSMFNSTMTVGYGASATSATGANGVVVTACSAAGILYQESTTGHVDYAILDSNTGSGVSIQSRSRAHIKGSTLTTNSIGVKAQGNSTWYNNPTTTNTFTSNTTDVQMTSGSVEEGYDDDTVAQSSPWLDTVVSSNATTSYVSAYTKSLKAPYLVRRGAGFELWVYWSGVGTNDVKTINVSVDGTAIATRALANSTTAASLHLIFSQVTDTSQQQSFATWTESGAASVVTVTTNHALTLSSDVDLVVEHKVANVSDTSRVQYVKVSMLR